MSDPAPAAEAAPSPPKAKGKSKLLIIGAVLVVAGGAGGGYWWWSNRAPAEAQAEAEPKAQPGIVSFEPFVANLADEGGGAFLRASLKLVIEGVERAKEVEENAVERAQLQSAILEVLTQQTADALVTPEGKAALKTAILARTGEVLHETPISDVLITEFVVQF